MGTKKNYTAEFKAKVAILAIKGDKGTAKICSEFNIPSTNLVEWKNKAIDNLHQVFTPENEHLKKQKIAQEEISSLHKIIGEMTIENNFLSISIRKQSSLLKAPRTIVYYKPVISDESEVANLIQEIYLSSDCRYGYRKVTAHLHNQGRIVNSKKVLRIMREMGIEGLYPKKHMNTSINNKEHRIYPYLLTDLEINRVNQVWATDLTYIKINNRFMYFMAIIDLFSRYVISYGLSHSMESEFCVEVLEKALKISIPEIFNTDQGSQYTSKDFTNMLSAKDIKISMDHKGRCFDNIYVEKLWRTLKQEVIYYYRPEDITCLEKKIKEFVPWYNNQRLHQALKYRTPSSIFLCQN